MSRDAHPWWQRLWTPLLQRPRRSRQPTVSLLVACGVLALGLAGLAWFGESRRQPIRAVLSGDGGPGAAGAIIRLIDNAHHRVWVMLFVLRLGDGDEADCPVAACCQAVVRAAQRGVEVRVVIDLGKRWGSDEIEPKHEAAVAWFATHGVQVELDEIDVTTHAKLVLVDERFALVGSHNWTRSALTRNREVSVLVEDPALVARLQDLFPRR